jgi:hypothetical protein
MAKKLKEITQDLPVYPSVRRIEEDNRISFKTVVRKRYDGKYYLVPMEFSGETEAKAIHGLHSNVYRYLMLGVLTKEDKLDEDQKNECLRLNEISNGK